MRWFTVWLFSVTLFFSAFLLFRVQPMIAKMVLPLLGGAPAVWSTCLIFFQAALLARYAFAHATTWLGVRRQAILQVVLVWLPLLVLPFGIHLPRGPVAVTRRESDGLAPRVTGRRGGSAIRRGCDIRPTLAAMVRRLGPSAAADPYFL